MMGLKKSHDIISIAVFKERGSSKHWIEIGKRGGLDKVSDDKKELVQLICCSIKHAKLEVARLKKKYGVSFFNVKHKD